MKRTKPEYEASYNVAASGKYKITVTLLGEHVLGSPFAMSVYGGLTNVSNTLTTGRGLEKHFLGIPLTFSLYTRDKFSNFRTSGNEDVQVFVIPKTAGASGSPSVVDKGTGERMVSALHVNYQTLLAWTLAWFSSLTASSLCRAPRSCSLQGTGSIFQKASA